MVTAVTPQKLIPLRPPKAPNLLIAPVEYSQQYQDQLLNALRLYFNQIDNFTSPLSTGAGGTFINFPYGSFYSTTTQSVATINTPTRVAFDSTAYANGMRFVAGDGIHVDYAGIYNVQFSLQLTNSDTQSHDMDIWIRKGTNGGTATDVANTASVQSVPSTHGGQPGYQVLAANFFIDLRPGDFIEFWWSSNSTQVQMNYLPAITSPFTSPGAPCVVCTLTFVSALY